MNIIVLQVTALLLTAFSLMKIVKESSKEI